VKEKFAVDAYTLIVAPFSSVDPMVKNTVSFAETVAPYTSQLLVTEDDVPLGHTAIRYVPAEGAWLQIAIVDTTADEAPLGE
jgi:hypothetical protein